MGKNTRTGVQRVCFVLRRRLKRCKSFDSPYDNYDPKRWWAFEKIFEEGTVLLSRPKEDQGFFVPSEGFIRPISLRLSIPLHNRKVKAIHRFKLNRNLIQLFLSPKTAVIQLNNYTSFR